MKTEIWIGGRKLCEVEEDNKAVQDLERIVRRAGYTIQEEEENGKIIKII
jgi:hypothetical protein